MDTFRQDLRFALRSVRAHPWFTLAAVTALTLGIGVNTAIFSVVNAVLLEPLPYPDPDRLVVFTTVSRQGFNPMTSPAKFNVLRQSNDVFRDVSGVTFTTLNLTGPRPEQVVAGQVSADFFRLFGATVTAGRTFTAAEDRPGGGDLVILSDGFWRRLGADRKIIGRTVTLGGTPHEVIGILAPFDTAAFPSLTGSPDLWVPFQLDPDSTIQVHYFQAIGRLRPGVTPAAVADQLGRDTQQFFHPSPGGDAPAVGFGTRSFYDISVGNTRTSLWMLSGAVGFVLLIACANVASLLLIRATARRHEIAVRAALGASRSRIVRQLLTESVVLALAGGALGLALGSVGIQALLAINPGNLPRLGGSAAAIGIDWHVLTFTAAVSVATGLLFGLFPSLGAVRRDVQTTLKESNARTGTGLGQRKAHSLLVMSEVGLALVLLVGAALFVRTFIALRAVNPGFETRHVMTLAMSLADGRFGTTAAVEQLIRNGTAQLNAVPGVEMAAAGCCVPLQRNIALPFDIEGRPLPASGFHGVVGFSSVSPTYLRTFKIALVRGRDFDERDTQGAPNVVIINQAMARRFWPTADPLNERITIARGLGPTIEQSARQIVGIAADVHDGALNTNPEPSMYVPRGQTPDSPGSDLTWFVRTRDEPRAMIAPIEDALRIASGGLPAAGPRTMEDVVARSTARHDFNMSLLTIFAGSALLLAAIGIYGLMAYSVEQRRQEIGIRLMIGADDRAIRNMVLRQGMAVALAGVALGVGAALGLSPLVAGFLFGVTARDPLVFTGAPLVLSAVAFLGVWLPARRAARIAPVTALRAKWE